MRSERSCPMPAVSRKKMCLARAHGTVQELPVKKKAKARRVEKRTVLVIRDGEKVALRKRPDRGLLAGMYELPRLSGHLEDGQVLLWLREYGLEPLRILPLGPARHIFSHVEWDMTGYAIQVAALDKEKEKDMIFVEIAQAEEQYARTGGIRSVCLPDQYAAGGK